MEQIRKKLVIKGKEKWVYSPFRSLANYKAMHAKTAKEKGVYAEFVEAQTLTRARRILFG